MTTGLKRTNQQQNKAREVSIPWVPQKRQLRFLSACGLDYPFSAYIDEDEEGNPRVVERDNIPPGPKRPEAKAIGYGGAAGGGKGSPASEVVATPYGLRKMEDIEVGNRICSPTHGNTEVIYKYDLGEREIFEVSFTDGTSLEVTSDHIWKISYVRRGKNKKGLRYKLMTTEQITNYLEEGYYDLQIPLPNPVQFTKSYRYSHRNVNPYILGALLGDGSISSGRVKIHSQDIEVFEKFAEEYDDEFIDYNTGEGAIYNSTGIIDQLENLGLWGCKSNDKFIPDQYLNWDIESRFELARGLFDTDGYVDERGHVSYCTVSPQLAEDVAFLVRSLGYRATVSEPQANYWNGERKQDKYRVYVQGEDKSKLFSLKRKKTRIKGKRNIKTHKKIESVEYLRDEQAYCIKVSNPNGLYIAGEDLIVTHNSDALLMALFIGVMSFPGASAGYFRRTYKQLEGAKGAIMRSKEIFSDFPGANWNGTKRMWTFESLNDSVIIFNHLQKEDSVYDYQSQQFDFIALDEATQFTEFQYRYMSTRNRTTVKGPRAIMLLATNPGNVGHLWFKSQFVDIGVAETPHQVELQPGKYREHIFIPAKLADNIVLEDRDPDYRNELETQPELERRRLLEGDWNIHEGQFFGEYKSDIHELDDFEISGQWKKFIALDYGLDMTAILFYAVDNFGFYYCYREYGSPNLALSQVAEKLMEITTPPERDMIAYCVASPDLWNRRQETGKSGVQILREAGLRNIPLRRADDRRVEGWRVVREYMRPFDDPLSEDKKVARIRFFKNATRKIRTHLPLIQHDDNNPDDVADEPHELTHFPEAHRYFCMSRPPLKSMTKRARKDLKRRRQRQINPRSKVTNY